MATGKKERGHIFSSDIRFVGVRVLTGVLHSDICAHNAMLLKDYTQVLYHQNKSSSGDSCAGSFNFSMCVGSTFCIVGAGFSSNQSKLQHLFCERKARISCC